MQPHKNNNGFHDRLTACVERVGGKRALAAAALISEAQLFRYLNSESDMPSDKLLAVAKAAGVDAGWLLTGNGGPDGVSSDPRPGFRPELMVQVVQTFEELLIESDKSFTPRQRAAAVTLIYEALRFEEMRRGQDVTVDKRLAPFYPDYLAPMRSDDRMEDYMNAMRALEMGQVLGAQTLKQFDALVKLGTTSAYEGGMGEIYFDKMGTTLLPEASKTLLGLVEKAQSLLSKDKLNWLDAGCGNGRHLVFLNQHCPNLTLQGFDGSKLAISECEKMVRSGKIPVGTVQEADFRSLPYQSDTLDVVYSRGCLHLLPHFPDHQIGALSFLSEIQRVLRKGGLALILTPQGEGRDYVKFTQYHTQQSIEQMAKATNLEVVEMVQAPLNETGGVLGKDYSSKYLNGLQFILRKT